jgi:predicted transposase YdaD
MTTNTTPPGPVYDNAAKLFTLEHRAQICRWLGTPTNDCVRMLGEDLAAYPKRVDYLLQVAPTRLAHIEFHTTSPPNLGLTMLIYLARLLDKYPGYTVEQHVVILRDGNPTPTWRQDGVTLAYKCHLIRHTNPTDLLQLPATMPFTVLANARNLQERKQLLIQSWKAIRDSTAPDKTTLTEIAKTFAGIYLPKTTVDQMWKETPMPLNMRVESSYVRGLLEEGEQLGKVTGKAEGIVIGKVEERVSIFRGLLRMNFGEDPTIDHLAHQLAQHDPEEILEAIYHAKTLDEVRKIGG